MLNVHDVIVIGAGFSGLSTCAALKRYGVDRTLLLEAGDGFANFWSQTYDRISLHSPWHGLPDDGELNSAYPIFKSRNQIVEYLTKYAFRHSIDQCTLFGTKVVGAQKENVNGEDLWKVDSFKQSYYSRYLVFCTGYCRTPVIPALENQEAFDGSITHTVNYKNGAPYVGQSVLVVGSGNSAFEIATDLVEHGASSVAMLVNGPRYVIPLSRFKQLMEGAHEAGQYGVHLLTAAHPTMPGSAAYEEVVGGFDSALLSIHEELTDFGISTPKHGPWDEALHSKRVPVFDHNAVELIRNGQIVVIRDQIASLGHKSVAFKNSGTVPYDAIILATGFRPGLDEFFSNQAYNAPDSRSGIVYPRTDGRCRSLVSPTLFFVGFDFSPWGGMAHGHWGFEVGEKIATELGVFSEFKRPAEFQNAPWLP